MKAREVWKAFSKFAADSEVVVKSKLTTSSSASSLLAFLQHLSRGSRAALTIRLPEYPFPSQPRLWACLGAASMYMQLKKLTLEHDLTLAEAGMLLSVLPARLESLEMHAPTRVLGNVSWRRLSSLKVVNLRLLQVEVAVVQSGSGIPCLPVLEEGSLNFVGETNEDGFPLTPDAGDVIELDSLRLPTHWKLTFDRDPFNMPPTPSNLPKLSWLGLLDVAQVTPDWILNYPMQHLLCISWRQLAGMDHSRIQCASFHGFHCGDEYLDSQNVLNVDETLAMPNLQVVEIAYGLGTTPTTPFVFRGAHNGIERFLETKHLQCLDESKIDVVVESSSGSPAAVVRLLRDKQLH